MNSKTLRLSAVVAVLVTSALLIGFILNLVNAEQLKTTLTKTLLVIGVIALTTLGVIAISGNKPD
jgi:hypothetical protein